MVWILIAVFVQLIDICILIKGNIVGNTILIQVEKYNAIEIYHDHWYSACIAAFSYDWVIKWYLVFHCWMKIVIYAKKMCIDSIVNTRSIMRTKIDYNYNSLHRSCLKSDSLLLKNYSILCVWYLFELMWTVCSDVNLVQNIF